MHNGAARRTGIVHIVSPGHYYHEPPSKSPDRPPWRHAHGARIKHRRRVPRALHGRVLRNDGPLQRADAPRRRVTQRLEHRRDALRAFVPQVHLLRRAVHCAAGGRSRFGGAGGARGTGGPRDLCVGGDRGALRLPTPFPAPRSGCNEPTWPKARRPSPAHPIQGGRRALKLTARARPVRQALRRHASLEPYTCPVNSRYSPYATGCLFPCCCVRNCSCGFRRAKSTRPFWMYSLRDVRERRWECGRRDLGWAGGLQRHGGRLSPCRWHWRLPLTARRCCYPPTCSSGARRSSAATRRGRTSRPKKAGWAVTAPVRPPVCGTTPCETNTKQVSRQDISTEDVLNNL